MVFGRLKSKNFVRNSSFKQQKEVERIKRTYYFSTHGAGGFFLATDFTPDEEGLSAADILPVFRKACIVKP